MGRGCGVVHIQPPRRALEFPTVRRSDRTVASQSVIHRRGNGWVTIRRRTTGTPSGPTRSHPGRAVRACTALSEAECLHLQRSGESVDVIGRVEQRRREAPNITRGQEHLDALVVVI